MTNTPLVSFMYYIICRTEEGGNESLAIFRW
jgi:hypothetical protein